MVAVAFVPPIATRKLLIGTERRRKYQECSVDAIAEGLVILSSVGLSIVLARLTMTELFRAARIDRTNRIDERSRAFAKDMKKR